MLVLSLPQSVHQMLTWWHKTSSSETPEVTGGGDRCGRSRWLNSVSASGHDGEWQVQRWEGGQQVWRHWNWVAAPIEGNKQVETTRAGKWLNTPLDFKLLLYNFAPWHRSFKSQLNSRQFPHSWVKPGNCGLQLTIVLRQSEEGGNCRQVIAVVSNLSGLQVALKGKNISIEHVSSTGIFNYKSALLHCIISLGQHSKAKHAIFTMTATFHLWEINRCLINIHDECQQRLSEAR